MPKNRRYKADRITTLKAGVESSRPLFSWAFEIRTAPTIASTANIIMAKGGGTHPASDQALIMSM